MQLPHPSLTTNAHPLHFSTIPLLFISLSVSAQTQAQRTSVEQAIAFLRSACVTSGSSLELKASGDGSLQVRSILGSGVKGSVTLTKKELEGFADAASALGAQQASEMRNCMKPYIDKILAALLTGTANTSPQSISIQTGGNYFITSEFDKVIAAASRLPTTSRDVDAVAEDSGLHAAKVRLYLEIAAENDLGEYDVWGDDFKINKRGISYVLSKRLVQ
jgi:hypothetical protein